MVHNVLMTTIRFPKVAITGGAGYVGSALVPALLDAGYEVTVVDLCLYGRDVLPEHPRLRVEPVDIRDERAVTAAFAGAEAVIHLACISNDPSFELDPALGRSINYDAFAGLLRAAATQRVRRFIYASSSSVYGIKEQPDVREDAPCDPLTDYSKFKWLCEERLKEAQLPGCEWVILRPATVCGWAPRLRLDLTVNILTIHALVNKRITVFGGSQLRPNLHIRDMVAAYRRFLEAPGELIHGQTYNVGFQNRSVADIAEIVHAVIGDPSVQIAQQPSNDLRSYHVNSDRVRERMGFVAEHTIEDAVDSLCRAFRDGQIPAPLTDPRYYNIKRMQQLQAEGVSLQWPPSARRATAVAA